MSGAQTSFVHPTAEVEDGVQIGAGSRIWALAHVRRGARIGSDCVIGAGVTVDVGVVIGDRCKVQNAALLYRGLTVGDGVFIGPGAVFTNDRSPRAVTPDGAPRSAHDWEVTATFVEYGASIGANATVVAGVRIGAWSMVGAGAVVTRDVPEHALVLGVPARQVAWVCRCAAVLRGESRLVCSACGRVFSVPTAEPAEPRIR